MLRWLQWRNAKPEVEVTATVAGSYLCFYVANSYLGASGVMAVVIYGLYGSATMMWNISLRAKREGWMLKFWDVVAFCLNGIVFFFLGDDLNEGLSDLWTYGPMKLGDDLNKGENDLWTDVFIILPALYIFLTLLRAAMIALSLPFMKWSGASFHLPWSGVLFCTVGGIRGSVSLILVQGVLAYESGGGSSPGDRTVSAQMGLFTSGYVLMTLLINSPMLSPLLIWLKLTVISQAKQKVRRRTRSALLNYTSSVIDTLKQQHQAATSMLRGVDWNAVARYVDLTETLETVLPVLQGQDHNPWLQDSDSDSAAGTKPTRKSGSARHAADAVLTTVSADEPIIVATEVKPHNEKLPLLGTKVGELGGPVQMSVSHGYDELAVAAEAKPDNEKLSLLGTKDSKAPASDASLVRGWEEASTLTTQHNTHSSPTPLDSPPPPSAAGVQEDSKAPASDASLVRGWEEASTLTTQHNTHSSPTPLDSPPPPSAAGVQEDLKAPASDASQAPDWADASTLTFLRSSVDHGASSAPPLPTHSDSMTPFAVKAMKLDKEFTRLQEKGALAADCFFTTKDGQQQVTSGRMSLQRQHSSQANGLEYRAVHGMEPADNLQCTNTKAKSNTRPKVLRTALFMAWNQLTSVGAADSLRRKSSVTLMGLGLPGEDGDFLSVGSPPMEGGGLASPKSQKRQPRLDPMVAVTIKNTHPSTGRLALSSSMSLLLPESSSVTPQSSLRRAQGEVTPWFKKTERTSRLNIGMRGFGGDTAYDTLSKSFHRMSSGGGKQKQQRDKKKDYFSSLSQSPYEEPEEMMTEAAAEYRERLLSGLKRAFHSRNQEGLLSTRGLRILDKCLDGALEESEEELDVWERVEREIHGTTFVQWLARAHVWGRKVLMDMAKDEWKLRFVLQPLLHEFMTMAAAHLSKTMLVGMEVALELWQALTSSPQAQWLDYAAGEVGERLREELDSQADMAWHYIIDREIEAPEREIEAPERFQAIQTHRTALAVLHQQQAFVAQLVGAGMMDDSEAEALLAPIERRVWKLERRGPVWKQPTLSEDMSVPVFQWLKAHGELVSYPKGQLISSDAEGPAGIFIVINGMVRITLTPEHDTNDEEETFYMGTGGVGGLTSAMMGGHIPGFAVRAAYAEANALGKGPVVFHLPQAMVQNVKLLSAGGNVHMKQLELRMYRMAGVYILDRQRHEILETLLELLLMRHHAMDAAFNHPATIPEAYSDEESAEDSDHEEDAKESLGLAPRRVSARGSAGSTVSSADSHTAGLADDRLAWQCMELSLRMFDGIRSTLQQADLVHLPPGRWIVQVATILLLDGSLIQKNTSASETASDSGSATSAGPQPHRFPNTNSQPVFRPPNLLMWLPDYFEYDISRYFSKSENVTFEAGPTGAVILACESLTDMMATARSFNASGKKKPPSTSQSPMRPSTSLSRNSLPRKSDPDRRSASFSRSHSRRQATNV
eukprot:gene30883-35931_t